MSTQIVKGLLFHYSTEELAQLMNARADYHDDRANTKEGALPELKKAMETVKANTAAVSNVAMMSKLNNSPYHFDANAAEGLENDIRDHRNKALVFRTLSKHLVANATYELAEEALRRLEILK